jgi:hypothetical protein
MTRGLSVHSDSVIGVPSGVLGSESLLMFAQCNGGRKASSWDRSAAAARCDFYIYLILSRGNPCYQIVGFRDSTRAKEQHTVTAKQAQQKNGYGIIVTHFKSMFSCNTGGIPAGFS